MRCLILAVALLLVGVLKAQPPVVDFTIPGTACLNQTLIPTNTSAVDRYEWDFCQGDLSLTPVVSNPYSLTGNTTLGIDMVFDGTHWFGFVTDAGNNTVIRLSYGSDLNSQPTAVSLGSIFSGTVNPYDIKIVYDQGEWFGFVYGSGSGLISRLDFGTSLTNTPTSVILVSGGGGTTSGLDVVYADNKWHIIYTRFFLVTVVKLDAIRSTDLSNQITTTHSNSSLQFGDIKVLNYAGNWFAYTISYGGPHTLQRLSFGSTLLSTASTVDITGATIGSLTPYGIDGHVDNGDHILFVSTLQGSLVRINLGTDLSNPPVAETSLGAFGILSNTLKIVLVKSGSSWKGFSPSYSTGKIFEIAFGNPDCQTSLSFSNDLAPTFSYLTSGTKYVTLRGCDGGACTETSKNLVVQNLLAPEIEINNLGVCVNVAVQFSFQSDQVINTSDWDFGNGETSMLANPSIDFDAIGSYKITLRVVSANSCQNFTEKPIKIYDQPIAGFTSPVGLICTNNEFTFVNNTDDNYDGHLTYEWYVNEELKSSVRDFNYTFNSEGDQQVKLKTAIPGCFDEVTQPILGVQTGPVVNFNYTGKCEDETILFSNQSTGLISGYLWNFGDGNSSAQLNPTNAYSNIGAYNVSLEALGTNGCATTLTKPINIYSIPQTNFSIDLPPFACSGTPSQFYDITPGMPDSNIASWQWSFGDTSGSSSAQKNPSKVYTLAGEYLVSLTTTTNFGCSNSLQKLVTIYPSPTVNFSFGPACVNVGTQFTDLSSEDVKSWLWTIQSNTYSLKNPTHIFKSASTYNASLTVTAINNCVSQLVKNVTVPAPVITDFTAMNTCANASSFFDETNKGGNDPAVSWSWSFDNLGSASGSPAQHVFTSTGNRSITMNSTRQSGCIYSVTRTVPIIEGPHASFSVLLEAGAAPFPVDFVNASTLATSYVWKFGDPANSTSTQLSPSFTYTELGDYIAELTASNGAGCTISFSKEISVVIPRINAAISDFKLSKVTGSENWSAVATVENKSNVALINPYVYLDLSGHAAISDKLNQIIKPNESRTHTFASAIVPRSLQYACVEIKEANDEYVFDNRQCINLMDEYVSMGPYPNPANDEVILEWINDQDKPMELVIYNAAGQVVISRTYSNQSPGLNQVSLDVSKLATGIYFVNYSIDSRDQNFRFSIVR